MTDDSLATPRPDELERLRSENARLRRRLEMLWVLVHGPDRHRLGKWFTPEGRSRL